MRKWRGTAGAGGADRAAADIPGSASARTAAPSATSGVARPAAGPCSGGGAACQEDEGIAAFDSAGMAFAALALLPPTTAIASFSNAGMSNAATSQVFGATAFFPFRHFAACAEASNRSLR
eukprot:905888-Pyramimonas_sp.AAC.1